MTINSSPLTESFEYARTQVAALGDMLEAYGHVISANEIDSILDEIKMMEHKMYTGLLD